MFGLGVKTVTVDELADRLKENRRVLIDVREPHEFASGHIKGADALVRADLAAGFFFDTAVIAPGDGHVQDALVGGEGEPVGILGVCSGVAQGAIRRNPVHTVEAELPCLLWQASTRVREVDAPIRAGHEIIGPVDSFKSISDALKSGGISPEEAGLRYIPKTEMELDANATVQVMRTIEVLEDLDDVQEVFSNLTITDEAIARLEED